MSRGCKVLGVSKRGSGYSLCSTHTLEALKVGNSVTAHDDIIVVLPVG